MPVPVSAKLRPGFPVQARQSFSGGGQARHDEFRGLTPPRPRPRRSLTLGMPRDLELRRSGDFKPFQFEQIFSSDVCFRGVAIEMTTDAVRHNTELQPPMGHQAQVGSRGWNCLSISGNFTLNGLCFKRGWSSAVAL
jgi:hypothetical protein